MSLLVSGGWLVLGGLAVVGAAPAHAESDETLVLAAPAPGGALASGPAIRATVRWGLRPGEDGGWGFVRVDLSSEHGAARDVKVALVDGWGGTFEEARSRRHVRLPPRARVRLWLPVIHPEQQTLALESSDGHAATSGRYASGELPFALGIGDPHVAAASQALTTFLSRNKATSVHRSGLVGPATIGAADLPPSPAWLTATTLVIVDGGCDGLDDGERQRTLVRWARMGGTLVVLRRASVPAGPLRDATPDAAPRALGLGRVLGFDASVLDDDDAARVVALWLTGDVDGTVGLVQAFPAIAGRGLDNGEEIPGLGTTPVRGFFVLLLAFAVIAGPVSYLTLRRRKRLTGLVVVVPAVGTVFALAILGYGVVAEGLGTKGVVRSFSVLDQRDHTCATVAGRTLFSGWSPADLPLDPDGAVWARVNPDGRSYRRFAGTRVRCDLDADASRLDGAFLPSRTVAPIASAIEGRARDRLRFRRRADGGLDVLAVDGFAPLAGETTVVVRDRDGTQFVGGGAGPLRRVDERAGDDAYAALGREGATVRALDVLLPDADDEDRWYVYDAAWEARHREQVRAGLAAWQGARFPRTLPRGAYLARTTRAPLLDGLGLDVEWRRAEHLVFGWLAPDDVDG